MSNIVPIHSKFKVGDKVLLAYDGKGGRCTSGKIIKRIGCAVLVRFVPWAEKERGKIEEWFMPSTRSYCSDGGDLHVGYSRYVKPKGPSIHAGLFGLPGDFYAMWEWDEETAKRSTLTARHGKVKRVCDVLRTQIGKMS